MARYKAGVKEETRERIVKEASQQFRRKGVSSTSIADIMGALDMTVGGFYKHFDSKDELFRESLSDSLSDSSRRFSRGDTNIQGDDWLRMLAEFYLTTAHRDNVSKGCPVAALSADIGREGLETRQAYEVLLEDYLEAIQKRTGDSSDQGREDAWRYFSTLMGGLILSRSVASESLSEEILLACKKT